MIRKDSRLIDGFFLKSFSVEFWLSAEKISQLTNSWRYHQLWGSLGGGLKRDYNARSPSNTASLLYTRVVWLGRDASIMAHSRKILLASGIFLVLGKYDQGSFHKFFRQGNRCGCENKIKQRMWFYQTFHLLHVFLLSCFFRHESDNTTLSKS